MTDKQPKKATASFRQKAEESRGKPANPQRLRKTARTAYSPVRFLLRVIKKAAKPFSFLLWPFKTKPARFVGRILGAVLLVRYFRNSWQELKLVTWPNRKQTTQLTIAVFMFAIVFGVLISVTDYGLDNLFKKVLLK